MNKSVFGIAALLLAFVTADVAQAPAPAEPQLSGDITGLYSFVHEGELVPIEVTGPGCNTPLAHAL